MARPIVRPGNRLGLAQIPGRWRLPVYAVLDSIRSVWNVGSMFRTADAANLGGLFLCGATATPPRPDMEKTALGATEAVPWDYWPDPAPLVSRLRARGIQVVALEQTSGARSYLEFPYRAPVCFLVGNEVEGVSAPLLEMVDAAVEIPMSGLKRSLNVAVSFGVLAFELQRRLAIAGDTS